MRSLNDSWTLGGLTVPNRVVLAPLAGIGNWVVRLQAKRHGAGMVVSEMVSSHGVHWGDRKTTNELLRIDPRERERPGPIAVQLFGQDPDIMRSAAEKVAAVGADVIDINMGCPVPKVCKTGAGAALLSEPERALALARAAREGSGLPVTVKLRPGRRPGDDDGLTLAERLVHDAGVAAISIHPRHASQQHKGRPDYDLARDLAAAIAPAPLILSGGMREPEAIRAAFEHTGAAAVQLARGQLGNPWLFEQVLGHRTSGPTRHEVLAELDWVIEHLIEHFGHERATRYLRKCYPWYVERLGGGNSLQGRLQRADSIAAARSALELGVLSMAA